MKITITNKSKINNPVEFIPNNDPSFINSFEGDFDERIFKDSHLEYYSYLKHQINNLDKLNNLLNDINLHFEYSLLAYTHEYLSLFVYGGDKCMHHDC